MKALFVFFSLLICVASLSAQTLENGDFAKDKAGWLGDGKIVYLGSDGKISDLESPSSQKALQVELKKNRWTYVKQSLHPKVKDNTVSVAITVKALPDFQPLEESRDYSKEDFKEGGSYAWSAEVWPKCQLLVRVQDTTWYYRPFSLKPLDTWKTFKMTFENLSSRTRSVTVALPPGTGSVLLKEIK